MFYIFGGIDDQCAPHDQYALRWWLRAKEEEKKKRAVFCQGNSLTNSVRVFDMIYMNLMFEYGKRSYLARSFFPPHFNNETRTDSAHLTCKLLVKRNSAI